MNRRYLLPALLAALLCASGFSPGQADTPLESAMKHMSRAYKELSFDLQQPRDANKANYLALAAILKTEARTSRGLIPKKAATLPADRQAGMVAAYQKSIDDLIRWIDSLSQDIQTSQWDDARKVMSAIKQQMIYGHKDFRLKE